MQAEQRVTCDLCEGTGRLNASLTNDELDRVAALFDDGTGEPETTVEAAERFLDCIGGRIVPDAEDCPYCEGTGAFPEGECGACKGLGWI